MPILNLSAETDIYYELIEGDPAKPCLVFLHEGLGCCAMWKDFPAQLCQATGCRGLLYDRHGYGQSSPLTARRQLHYLHDYALCELPQVLAALLPGQDHFLVGHSDGGSIALIYAAQQPPRLRGIITEAAHVFVEGITLDGIRVADAAFGAGKLRALAKYHGDKTESIFKAWSDTWLSYGFQFWNIEYLLPSVECPALVVQGSEDQYGSAAQVDTIVAQALNAMPAMVEQCGHTPHQEQPQALLALMEGFLQGRMDAATHPRNT
ncbi:2-succinyl-6-hydroxy-2,4-cyclohexadiene-1-carboxylate synthase [Janthinobacterium sp. KBS0711]|uniref:alpha/beta fold hydrolase n=1 Tax=Janthinobacterium sp. KBS0711 TaxID=1649647 RepID=UPI000628122B|nr:alpha/beta hydrolase [Janthinobacterium sp. KBS0711]KKO60919.1 2-succinyl-6-hydroxy-2,4-cyclohexadiene-1-carboxylate synthase [Janthinobacterium sp. KBS0711]TSD73192.1 alpha/beta hydrolase [Janthinobacterium sp. KBS0711]